MSTVKTSMTTDELPSGRLVTCPGRSNPTINTRVETVLTFLRWTKNFRSCQQTTNPSKRPAIPIAVHDDYVTNSIWLTANNFICSICLAIANDLNRFIFKFYQGPTGAKKELTAQQIVDINPWKINWTLFASTTMRESISKNAEEVQSENKNNLEKMTTSAEQGLLHLGDSQKSCRC